MTIRKQFINVTFKFVFLVSVINLLVTPLSAQKIKEKKTDNQINKCRATLASAHTFDRKDPYHINKIKSKANLLIQAAIEQENDSLSK